MIYDLISKPVCALGVMAKAPIAGSVKTRLVPPLTEQEAAELNVCFLRDVAENIASVSETEAASGLIVYTPYGSESAFDAVLPNGFKLLAQRGRSGGGDGHGRPGAALRAGAPSLRSVRSVRSGRAAEAAPVGASGDGAVGV